MFSSRRLQSILVECNDLVSFFFFSSFRINLVVEEVEENGENEGMSNVVIRCVLVSEKHAALSAERNAKYMTGSH